MKTRHLCALLGVAVAVGTVSFMQSLVKTNADQSLALAQRLLDEVVIPADASVSRLALDYRPDGRVMQGPPLRIALAAGDSLDGISNGWCVVTRSLFAQRRLEPPPVGSELTLVGRQGAYRLKIAAILPWERPVRGYPNAFVSRATASTIDEDWQAWEAKSAEDLSPLFMSDEERHFDSSKLLLVWAAILTALCLIVNTLFLSVESGRRELATLRVLGLTRLGVVQRIVAESLVLAFGGWLVGTVVATAFLWWRVAADAAAFPMGMSLSVRGILLCLVMTPLVATVAALIALRPALSVRPLEAASARPPRKRHLGLIVAFACGFGAFVAVEVWGSSLMSAFIPSKELPDAIVSILPGGISSFEIEKLQGRLPGVRRIHELVPLQVNFDPLDPISDRSGPSTGRPAFRNVLLLGSDWLPELHFVAGTREEALRLLGEGDNCVITEMMARARNLNLGDSFALDAGGGLKMALKVVGIVDCNWHLVTSRGLLRGLNRMPINTDGPAFVSFDTVAACDVRPAEMVNMTHLWLDYETEFLRTNGVFQAGRLVERSIVSALDGAYRMDDDEQIRGNTVRLHARDEVSDGTLAHGNEIIGAMARVPFIFILVVSFGFVALLVASAESRKREFIVLRTIGATRLQLAGELTKEALCVALCGLAIGFPTGALAGWLFTGGTRGVMANWGLPANFAVPWSIVFEGALGAVAFALLVAVPTSLLLVRKASDKPSACVRVRK